MNVHQAVTTAIRSGTVANKVEPKGDAHSYAQILRSSALIGGSSVVTVGVSIVRVKVLALLLGPSGVGMAGLYVSILELAQSLAGMGLNSSGVRQIAQAAGAGDRMLLARTAKVLRSTSVALGILGAAAVLLLRSPISQWTFGNQEFAASIGILALAVFFRAVSDGQAALIQGTRRIADLARIAVMAAVFGAGISIVCVLLLGERGLVPMLVSVAGTNLAVTWWYRRKVDVPTVKLSRSELTSEARALLSLGFTFMAMAVLTTSAGYVVRTLVANVNGLEAAGLYHAAWALGGLYTAFILQAMGSDFYPRLTGVSDDHAACNRLVNEQAMVGMLLAAPGVIATLTFAPSVLYLLYARDFGGAVEPLRWICVGMALRVIAWPMGYIVLAKGAQGALLAIEIAAAVVHIGLAAALIRPFGVEGATMAFCGLYIWHGLLVHSVVCRLTGFAWSPENRALGMLFMAMVTAVFVACRVLPPFAAGAFGATAFVVSGVYSLRALCILMPDRCPQMLRRVPGLASRGASFRGESPGVN